MKKALVIISGLLVAGLCHAANVSKEERALQQRTQELQQGGGYGKTALKGGVIGGATGVAVPTVGAGVLTGGMYAGMESVGSSGRGSGVFSTGFKEGATGIGSETVAASAGIGAMIGAAVAVARQAGINAWQLRKINNALNKHGVATPFRMLPPNQAMLLVAAYKRNLPMLKVLVEREAIFVNQPGVWNALAELNGTGIQSLQMQIAKQRVNQPAIRRQIADRLNRATASARSAAKKATQKVAEAL